jgi:hypothetical protein
MCLLCRRLPHSANHLIIGVPIAKWAGPDDDTAELQQATDPWNAFLPLLFAANIAVVCPAGNAGMADSPDNIDAESPRRYALPGRPGEQTLLVAGASTAASVPWSNANKFYSIATTWAPGDGVSCASSTSYTDYVVNSGSSLSTALTSGMAATYLSTRVDLLSQLENGASSFSANMWKLVQDTSASVWAGTPATVPTLTTYNWIPCSLRDDDSDVQDANFTTTLQIRTSSGTILNKNIVSERFSTASLLRATQRLTPSML